MFSSVVLTLLTVAFDVQSAGNCPAARDVQAALSTLASTDSAGEGRIAEVFEVPDGLRLELRSEGGNVLASRELRTKASCAQRASSVAVVLAAWHAELSGGPQQAPILPAPEWEARFGADLSLGMTQHTGVQLLPSAAAVVRLRRSDATWGWLGRVAGGWPGRSPIADQAVLWIRPLPSIEAGPWFEFSRLFGSLQAEVLGGASLLWLRGDGFIAEQTSAGVDLSVSPGVRWIFGSGPWRPSAAVGATFWLIPQRVRVAGAAEARVLPQWDVHVSVGFSWGR